MLKKMLNSFAGKFLTLALVMSVFVPALQAAPQEGEPFMSDTVAHIGVNIPEGGFKIKSGQNMVVYDLGMSNGQAMNQNVGNCSTNFFPGYYTCEVKELMPGGYDVYFNDVQGYQTPAMQFLSLNEVDDVILVDYKKDGFQGPGDLTSNPPSKLTFNVKTQDNQGNPLNEQYTRLPALTTHNTPDSFSELLANLNNFSFEFKDKPGYTKPGTVVITNKVINTIPTGVSILENGANYAPGTALKPNATYTIIGTYTKQDQPYNGPLFTITKQKSEVNIGNGNKRVDYTITVTRDPNGPAGNFNILVDDTVNDNGNRTINGSNGGVMKVVQVNGKYSVCSNNCGDITLNPVNITTTKPGEKVTLTYRMESDNSTIPDNQTSNFTNTVVGKYNDGQGDKQISAQATVNVPGDQDDGDEPFFDIDKKVVSELNLANGNKRVDYQITITRDANGPNGNFSILVDDTVNDNNNRTLYGSNGGTMKVVQVGQKYSNCSNNCGDITAGPVTVQTTQPGQVVTITYRMESDNAGIPDNQTSNFTNTVIGKYTHNGQEYNPSDKVTVNVPGDDDGEDDELFTIDKKVTNQKQLAGGNLEVTYQITVKRSANGPSGTYYVLVDDTINDNNNRTINGSNGGTLKVVVDSNGKYSTCSNNCGDITAGPVNVKTTYANEEVVMTYKAVTDNSTVPAGQTSSFVNTAVARYTYDGQTKEPSKQVTVSVTKPAPGQPVPTTPTYYTPAGYTPVPAPVTPTPAPAPPTPAPPATPQNGPGSLMLILMASALGAYAWQRLERKKAAVTLK